MRQPHQTLQQVARSLRQGSSVSQILQQIADALREDLQVDCCWISGLQHPGYRVGSPTEKGSLWQKWDGIEYRAALAVGKIITLDSDELVQPNLQCFGQTQKIRSMLLVPLQYQQMDLGEIVLAQYKQHHWTSDDIEWAQTLSDYGAIALHQAYLEDQLNQERAKPSSLEKSTVLEKPRQPFINTPCTNEELLRVLTENIRDVFWITNRDATELLYVSPAYEMVWGVTRPAELQALPDQWVGAICAEDMDRVKVALETLPQGIFYVEYRIQRPDGSIRWIRDRGFPVHNEAGEIDRIIGVAEDVTERKTIETQQAAAILHRSEERYKALVEASPDLLFRLDRNGCYLDWHAKTEEELYMPPDRLVGLKVSEVLPANIAAQVRQAIDAAFNTGNLQVFEYELHIQNEQRQYEARVVRSGEAEVVAIVRDITEWKQTEAALRESEQRWQFAISGSQAGIWDWDLTTGEIFYSPRWRELHDLAPDEPDYSIEEWRNSVHPDDRPLVDQALQAHLAQKTPFYEAEYRVRRKDGSYIWVADRGRGMWDEESNLLRMSGSETDITERKQAELALKESETRLRLALEAAQMGVWDYDILTHQETWMGRSEAILGFAPGTFDSDTETFLSRVHADDRDRVRDCHELPIDAPTCQFEYRVIHPDQSIHWIASRGQVFYNANGQAFKMTGVDMDITDRKQMEEQLKASLEEKNTLLQEVHHRVKNNLQTISSLLKLQAASIQDPATLKLFEDSQHRVRAMALIHELLYQSSNLARINFANYVQTLATDLLKSYKTRPQHIQLRLELMPLELSINVAIPCGLIINELVTNALKYAFVDRPMGAITIQFNKDDLHQYTLIVQDDGIGIPEEFNLSQRRSLGMQLVTALTRQLQGTITLDRNPTTFKVSFPGSKA